MAQSVFRSNEVTTKEEKVVLQFTKNFEPPKEEVVEVVPEYTGPTAEDLRREAEAFKESWEHEKQKMLEKAQAEADQIVKNAEEAAFSQVKRQSDQAAVMKTQAQKEAERCGGQGGFQCNPERRPVQPGQTVDDRFHLSGYPGTYRSQRPPWPRRSAGRPGSRRQRRTGAGSHHDVRQRRLQHQQRRRAGRRQGDASACRQALSPQRFAPECRQHVQLVRECGDADGRRFVGAADDERVVALLRFAADASHGHQAL